VTVSGGEAALNRLLTLVMAGCAALVLGTLLLLAAGGTRSGAEAQASGYVVGTTIDLPAELVSGADRTILVFARSSCAACRRSTPALQSLVAAASASPATQVLLVTSAREDRDADRALAAEIGLTGAQVHRAPFDRLRLKVVPSIIVVDRAGVVLDAHVGAPDPEATARLLRAGRTAA